MLTILSNIIFLEPQTGKTIKRIKIKRRSKIKSDQDQKTLLTSTRVNSSQYTAWRRVNISKTFPINRVHKVEGLINIIT